MCRIAGIYNATAENLEADILKMADSMHRGGPDDSGIYLHPHLPFALGHRRLALIDLSAAGHQPMQISDGSIQIVFNGEIYNFRELRSTLISHGHQFTTESDTEVILFAYREWGTQCLERLNGMFAMAIWDEKEQAIILARDHAGIKPLYYSLKNNTLVFASEVKAFSVLNYQYESEPLWEPLFLMFGHLPEPFTTLKDVQALAKGTWLKIHLPTFEVSTGTFSKNQFTSKITSRSKAKEAIREVLPAAVKRHLISDAPIGLFLSGGIDSSLLTLLAAPVLKDNLQTLSIQFSEPKYSEAAYQKIIIDITGARHRSFNVNRNDFENAWPDIFEAMDQPSIDAINTYFISMYARQSGLKAVLSGLGADELFGGYPSFKRFNQWKLLSYIPEFATRKAGNNKNNKIAKLSFGRFHPMLSLYLTNRGLYTAEQAAAITDTRLSVLEDALEKVSVPKDIDYKSLNANSVMEQDFYMKHQLLKDADYMAMWHGVEIRVPFLDKELIEVMNRIDPAIKFGGKMPKSLLIEAFEDILPAEIWNRKKQGFLFPFAAWLKQSAFAQPEGAVEMQSFQRFKQGDLHWSRYWALKVVANFNNASSSYETSVKPISQTVQPVN